VKAAEKTTDIKDNRMASDPTAGGASAEMPAETPEQTLDIPPRPAGQEANVQQLLAEKADLQDKLLRALAEAQNVRRRAQQDVERERKFGVERFAKDMLSVADNLGRALSALPKDSEVADAALRNVIVGVQATERELQSALERHGVTRIDSLGKPFNAEFHQAMMEIEDSAVPSGTVVQELIPGYLIAGRLLRAAMVGVSKGGPSARAVSNEN
jgi:molecular chaperone GrpE